MNIKKTLLLAVPFLFSACASIQPQQFVGPSGKTAYSMKCSGMGRTLDACYKKAGEICPSGYAIVDHDKSLVGVPMNGGMMMAEQHNIAIECK